MKEMSMSEVSENILYECLVYVEWPQEPEILQGKSNQDSPSKELSSWNLLRSWKKNSSFTDSLIPFRNHHIEWSFSIDLSGKLLAVLLNQCIEIRSIKDEFSSVIAKAKVEKDPHPQWRLIKWSPDSKFILCTDSFGSLNVYDIFGSSVFTSNPIQNNNSRLLPNPAAAIIFVKGEKAATDGRTEILVLYHNGTLQSFYSKSSEEFMCGHSYSFTSYYPQGITAAAYHPDHQVLLISGPVCFQIAEQEASKGSVAYGISLWRILNDSPYYKLITTLSENYKQVRLSSWKLSYFSFNSRPQKEVAIFLSISPDGKNAISLHANGAVMLWNFPSLRLDKAWQLKDQPDSDMIHPSTSSSLKSNHLRIYNVPQNYPVELNWWSNQEIVMSRLSGAVTVSSVETLRNILGNSPEWFEPCPQISAATNGSFYVLECENQVSKKRRLVSDMSNDESAVEEEFSSDEEEDVSIIRKSKQSIKSVLYYVTDSERFQPPRKKPKIVTKTYRLLRLKSTTPEELYAHKIDCEEYGEALSLAVTYGFDCDLVYQRQWRKSTASVSSIQDYLSKITKRSWVLHECLERVPENIDAAKELLLFGLRGTDLPTLISIGKGDDRGKFILCDRHTLYAEEDGQQRLQFMNPEEILQQRLEKEQTAIKKLVKQVDFENLTLEQKQLISYRTRLFTYLDRLSTYEVLLGGLHAAEDRFDSKFYKTFRMKSSLRCALDFARQSNWQAVEALFTYHGTETLPYRLTIISNFPETTSPFEYQSLLPECEFENKVSLWLAQNWRERDWSEDPSLWNGADLHAKDNRLDDDFDDIEFVEFEEKNVTPLILSEWYRKRAFEIEAKSFLVDNAFELIKLGLENNIPDLEMLYDDLVTMETLVYECLAGPEILLAEFCQMSDLEKLKLLLSFSTDENFVKNFSRWALPFLQQHCKRNKDVSQLLSDYFSYLATVDLSFCLKIFDAALQDGNMLTILGRGSLVNCAIKCISVYERKEQLKIANDIFHCVPKLSNTARMLEIEKIMKRIENFLLVAEILESNDILHTVQEIDGISQTRGAGLMLLKKFSRKATRRNMSHGELWRQILYDILEIRSKLFAKNEITEDECFQIFTESLLCSGSKTNIKLAGHMINNSQSTTKPPIMSKFNNPLYYKRVDFKDGIRLITSAAKEYFNSASDLLDPCMELSRSCLLLIEEKEENIQGELDLISSLGILNDFNVQILPVQVRAYQDRLDLIKMAIEASPKAFKNSQQLLKLAYLLRINSKYPKICEGKVLHLLADAAFKVGDFDYCWKYCSSLVKLEYEDGWVICEKLGLCEKFSDLFIRCELISYALCHCPVDRIQGLLDMKGLLEVEILSDKMKEHVDVLKEEINTSDVAEPSLSSQMKQVYEVTSNTSKVILDKLPGQEFWKNATKWAGFANTKSDQGIDDDQEKDNFEIIQQGVAEFFASFFKNYFTSQIDPDFSSYSVKSENLALRCAQILLRLSLLDHTLSEGQINNFNSEVILSVVKHVMPNDATSGIGLLLSLTQPLDAEPYLSNLPKTEMALQLITYYYALQIYRLLRNSEDEISINVCKVEPSQLVLRVKKLLRTQELKNEFPKSVAYAFLRYYECLADFIQGQALTKLNFGVDIPRFASDSGYKQETILGLSMTTNDDVYGIAHSLAHRYNVSLWKFYSTHLVYLFLEESVSKMDLEKKVKDSNMIQILLEEKDLFKLKLLNEILPSISGTDLPRLLLFYTLLEKCDDQEIHGQKPNQHVKSIKKFMNIAPGINYKAATEGSESVLDVVYPHLHKENLNAIIKLAPKIPNKNGSYLDSSSVYCLWAQKLFFKENEKSSRQPKSDDTWYQRLHNCREYALKLKPSDYLTFMNRIIFVDRSLDEMSMACRVEIIKRSAKFVAHQLSRTTGEMHEKWEEIMDNLRWNITHLELMKNEPIYSFSQSEDPILRGYARHFDLSRSQESEVKELLMKTVIDGQPFSLLEDLLLMCHSVGLSWDSRFIYEETILFVLTSLRDNPHCQLGSYKKKALLSLKLILEHMKNVDADTDFVPLLRKFYSDLNIPVNIRLSVLQLSEEFSALDEEGKISKLLLQTILHLKKSWPDLEITTSNVACEESRQKLFKDLLQDSSKLPDLATLCEILCSWPSLQEKTKLDENENLWFLVLSKMITLGTKTSLDQALDYLSKYRLKVIPSQMLIAFVDAIANQHSPYHFIKICLICDDAAIHGKAINEARQLSQFNKDDCDEQIFDLILLQGLLQEFAKTVLFEPCIEFLLDHQAGPIEEHYSVEGIVTSLMQNGYDVEAGALFLRHRCAHQSFIDHNSAVYAVKYLMKK